jgi:voltage-gated sodium channel
MVCPSVATGTSQDAKVESHKSSIELRVDTMNKVDSGRSWKSQLSPQPSGGVPSKESSSRSATSNLSGAAIAYDQHMTTVMVKMMPKEHECPVLFKYRMQVFKLIYWQAFDYFIGFVIVMNAVTVGIEQSLRYANEDKTVVDAFENCFLIVYLVELGMRIFACGLKCLRDNYVRFDALLVALGLLSFFADALLDDSEGFGPIMILRFGRLLRLARTARLLVKFRELWIMVRGLMSSLGTILYTMLLLLLILFTFSCISMEFITPLRDSDDVIVKEIVSTHFSNLPQTMLTLLQFVCLDSVAAIYKPLVEHQPWLVVFFVTVILVVPIVLMNLVTAVVVSGAFKDALAVYEQQQKKRMIHELRQVFERVDGDGSGKWSTREIIKMNSHDLDMLKHLTSMDEPMDIVHMLDVDGDGEIGIDEFLNGLWQIVVSKVPDEMRLELKRMQKCIREQTKELKQAVGALNHQAGVPCSSEKDRCVRHVHVCQWSSCASGRSVQTCGHTSLGSAHDV